MILHADDDSESTGNLLKLVLFMRATNNAAPIPAPWTATHKQTALDSPGASDLALMNTQTCAHTLSLSLSLSLSQAHTHTHILFFTEHPYTLTHYVSPRHGEGIILFIHIKGPAHTHLRYLHNLQGPVTKLNYKIPFLISGELRHSASQGE